MIEERKTNNDPQCRRNADRSWRQIGASSADVVDPGAGGIASCIWVYSFYADRASSAGRRIGDPVRRRVAGNASPRRIGTRRGTGEEVSLTRASPVASTTVIRGSGWKPRTKLRWRMACSRLITQPGGLYSIFVRLFVFLGISALIVAYVPIQIIAVFGVYYVLEFTFGDYLTKRERSRFGGG